MKILQMLPSLEVGGVERGVIDLARGMKLRGHQAPVMSSGGALVAELSKMGVPHYELPVHKKSLSSLSLVSKIVEIIRRERIDAVHARSRVPAWLGWIAARRANVPFITTCHGYYSTHLFSTVMGWGVPLIVPSNVIGRHMIEDFGTSPEHIRLIPRGVDLNQFKHSTARFDKSTKPLRVIHVGRFSPIKGQVEFLRAVHLVRSRFPDFEVWLVGSEGGGKNKYTKKIHETIRQLGLENTVKLLGSSRNIPELMAETDLMVMSTIVPEAFGRVIIEAGAVGVPVISTRVGGVVDIIEHDYNGLLVDPGSIPDMAGAIFELLKDRTKARLFADRLRAKVEKEFTVERMVERTIEVYQEIGKQQKILLIKLGAAGDVILSVPSMRMLKKRYPQSRLTVMVDKNLGGLIANVPYVDDVVLVQRKKLSNFFYLLKTAKRLRAENFDFSIDLQNTKWTHFLAWLGGVKLRFGYKRGPFGFFLNRPDPTFDQAAPPIQHQFRILSKAGVTELDQTLELESNAESEKRVDSFFAKIPMEENTKVIGFVVGSSPSWPTKRWPLSYFEDLAGKILEKYDARILLIGSPDEQNIAELFNPAISPHIHNLVGQTQLEDLVALLKRCHVLVTGDTAPLHVASAVATPVVSFFGPTSPSRHMPPHEKATVLVKNLPCQPCYSGKCKNKEELACLKKISVQEVFLACVKYLK
ncbi:MAG TPA: lipopolysaccharide heptosyltransferase II [Candidatus Omnitrophota bacterium]|nr:lipopolysaccharide heptosyltransferase II [Candidatus Omnitrophota bacterium]